MPGKRVSQERLDAYFAEQGGMYKGVMKTINQTLASTPNFPQLEVDQQDQVLSAPFLEPKLQAIEYNEDNWGHIVEDIRELAEGRKRHEAWQKEIEDLKKRHGSRAHLFRSPRTRAKRKGSKAVTIEVVPNTDTESTTPHSEASIASMSSETQQGLRQQGRLDEGLEQLLTQMNKETTMRRGTRQQANVRDAMTQGASESFPLDEAAEIALEDNGDDDEDEDGYGEVELASPQRSPRMSRATATQPQERARGKQYRTHELQGQQSRRQRNVQPQPQPQPQEQKKQPQREPNVTGASTSPPARSTDKGGPLWREQRRSGARETTTITAPEGAGTGGDGDAFSGSGLGSNSAWEREFMQLMQSTMLTTSTSTDDNSDGGDGQRGQSTARRGSQDEAGRSSPSTERRPASSQRRPSRGPTTAPRPASRATAAAAAMRRRSVQQRSYEQLIDVDEVYARTPPHQRQQQQGQQQQQQQQSSQHQHHHLQPQRRMTQGSRQASGSRVAPRRRAPVFRGTDV